MPTISVLSQYCTESLNQRTKTRKRKERAKQNRRERGNKAKKSEASWLRKCLSKSFYLSHLEQTRKC